MTGTVSFFFLRCCSFLSLFFSEFQKIEGCFFFFLGLAALVLLQGAFVLGCFVFSFWHFSLTSALGVPTVCS